jgi:hypothetical protein
MREEVTFEEKEIDWEDVENKISMIVRKFNNIDDRYRDDLAQELRIHAYTKSTDFYDLKRKAIDFWRTMQRKVYPEVPTFDLEMVGGSEFDDAQEVCEFDELLSALEVELDREGSVSQMRLNTISREVLDIILEDIQDGLKTSCFESVTSRYINGRINCTYLAERLPEINYKMIRKALKNLEDILGGLMAMRGIIVDGYMQTSPVLAG